MEVILVAKLPSTILSVCASKSVDYTLRILGTDKQTYESTRFMATTESCIMPFDDVTKTFYECGYGREKTEKWINEWSNLGFAKWYFYNSSEKYITFFKPLSPVQKEMVKTWLIDEKRKKADKDKALTDKLRQNKERMIE